MTVDPQSGRIYTLNSNWILEIWNIELNSSFPQKRISVCSNEGGKDFINLYYRDTFNGAKPKFLSLQESNQQILVVNTSCVDGCIVFIDPISFSVLKKIQLRYSDYEIPKAIKDSIRKLRLVFENLATQTSTDKLEFFQSCVDKDTGDITIRNFVEKLHELDHTFPKDELYKICYQLDDDGSGTISTEEFIHYFQTLN